MFQAVTERLNEIAKTLDEQVPDVALVQSFNELQAEYLQRVFVDGVQSDGSKIGSYSARPNYFGSKAFIQQSKFKPIGKNGETKFKTVTKPRKSMYLKNGYKELRDIQGRPVNTINLDYTGSLKRAYRVFKFGDSVLFGQNDSEEHKKIEGLTERFGEFQELTQTEVDNLKASIGQNVALILKK